MHMRSSSIEAVEKSWWFILTAFLGNYLCWTQWLCGGGCFVEVVASL